MVTPCAFRLAACTVVAVSAHVLAAGEPVQPAGQGPVPPKVINYRNDGSGVYPDAQPPLDLDWSAPTSILWKTPIPGSACASDPIIVGDRIFVQSEPLRLICLDRNTGKVLWERAQHAKADVPEEDKAFRLERYYLWWAREVDSDNKLGFGPKKALANGKLVADVRARVEKAIQDAPETWLGCTIDGIFGWPCCSSPVSDGRRVVAAFRTGEVVSYDLEGNRQWLHLILNNDGTVPTGDVKGHTPLLADGRVVVYWTAPARFECLEAASGRVLWRTDLTKFEGRGSSRNPVATRRNGVWYACSPAGTVVRTADGAVPNVSGNPPAAIRGRGRTYHSDISVSHADGVFDCGYRGIAAPESKDAAARVVWSIGIHWLQQGLVGDAAPLSWEDFSVDYEKNLKDGADKRFSGWGGERHFAAGVTREGLLYSYSSSNMAFAARELHTGKLLYLRNLTDKLNPNVCQYADLCLAGDYIFVNNGAVVLKTGREFNLVKRMRTGGHFANNLVFDGQRVYWREAKNLVCVGSRDAAEAPAKEMAP